MIITSSRARSMGFGNWLSDVAGVVATPFVFTADVSKAIALPIIDASGSILGHTASVVKGAATTLHPNVVAPPPPSNLPIVLGLGGAAVIVLVLALSGGRHREARA